MFNYYPIIQVIPIFIGIGFAYVVWLGLKNIL